MSVAHDIPGMVFKNGSVILLARVLGTGGAPITRATISSATYTVYQLDESDANAETAVAGHTARSLVVSDIVFDALQTDDLWDTDAVGYNFKHTIDTSSQQAFATAGLSYRVRYELIASNGQVIIVRFKLKAI